MPEQQAVYLGDGAYAEWNGWSFVVYTSNGIERTNEVYLEPSHMRELIRFTRKIGLEVPA